MSEFPVRKGTAQFMFYCSHSTSL